MHWPTNYKDRLALIKLYLVQVADERCGWMDDLGIVVKVNAQGLKLVLVLFLVRQGVIRHKGNFFVEITQTFNSFIDSW